MLILLSKTVKEENFSPVIDSFQVLKTLKCDNLEQENIEEWIDAK